MSSSNLPLATNSKGHYRFSTATLLPATMAANARIWSIRNTGTNLLIPLRLTIRAVQAAAGTAQLAELAVYRCTAFAASDVTNVASASASVVSKRGDMTAAPGGAEMFVTTGFAAGMTGGTLTKDSNAFSTLLISVTAAANTAPWQCEALDGLAAGAHPFVLQQNEGIELENVLVNTTSYGVSVAIDFAWAEVGSFGQ